MYVWGGVKDNVVNPLMPKEQEKYYKSIGANVKEETGEFYGHWFHEMDVAGKFSDFAYKTLKVKDWELKPYTIVPKDHYAPNMMG